jgi:quercetin dioxygenase-like cupin family protein
VPAGLTEVSWHNSPSRKIVICLTGQMEYETSDGDVRRLPAGSVVLSEDTTGKGHISRHPPEGQLLVFIDVEEGWASA